MRPVHPAVDGCELPDGLTVAHTVSGFRMAVPRDDAVGSHIARHGFWEIRSVGELAALAGATLPHTPGWFFDVGANLGYYSLLFAWVGWRVLAVEPMAANRRALETSLCLNPRLRDRVTVVSAALSDGTDDATNVSCIVASVTTRADHVGGNGKLFCGANMQCPSTMNGSDARALVAKVYRFGHMKVPFNTVRMADCDAVRMLTLDRLAATHRHLFTASAGVKQRPGIIKFDIEGAECLALRGGSSLLTGQHPLFVQWEGKDKDTDACMRTGMLAHGYRIGTRLGHDRNTVATLLPKGAGA